MIFTIEKSAVIITAKPTCNINLLSLKLKTTQSKKSVFDRLIYMLFDIGVDMSLIYIWISQQDIAE